MMISAGMTNNNLNGISFSVNKRWIPGGSGARTRHVRATPAPRLTLSPRVKLPEDERSRAPVAPRISASEPAYALKCNVSLREKAFPCPVPV